MLGGDIKASSSRLMTPRRVCSAVVARAAFAWQRKHRMGVHAWRSTNKSEHSGSGGRSRTFKNSMTLGLNTPLCASSVCTVCTYAQSSRPSSCLPPENRAFGFMRERGGSKQAKDRLLTLFLGWLFRFGRCSRRIAVAVTSVSSAPSGNTSLLLPQKTWSVSPNRPEHSLRLLPYCCRFTRS